MIDLRAPHKTTRTVVDAEGNPLAKELYLAFDEYNRAYFDGRLDVPFVLIAPTSSPRALGDAIDRDAHGLRSPIRIRPDVFMKGGLKLALDVLLHEMVHVWQYEVMHEKEDGYQGHGPIFTGKCNEIGKLLGLPEVSVKARKGPPSSQWPCSVRPAGYYPAQPTRAKRLPRAKEGPARGDSEEGDGDDAAPARTLGGPDVARELLRFAGKADEAGDRAGALLLRRAAEYVRTR